MIQTRSTRRPCPSEPQHYLGCSPLHDQTSSLRERHEGGGVGCNYRLGELHAGRTNRSLRHSFWVRPLRTRERRRFPGRHDLRGHQYRDRHRAQWRCGRVPPSANGDLAPEASFTNGSYGPTTMVFDSSGDLWVANENTSDLFELTKAELGMPNPVPAVTRPPGPSSRSPEHSPTPSVWLSTPRATSGWSVTLGTRSTSTRGPNWPPRAVRRRSPPFRTSRAVPLSATPLTPPGTCGCPLSIASSSFRRPSWPRRDPAADRHHLLERRRGTCLRFRRGTYGWSSAVGRTALAPLVPTK